LATYAQKLTNLEAAIAKIEGGAQEVRYDGRIVRFADLDRLYAERKRLEPLAAAEASPGGGRMTIRYGVPS
jgi:hypothetical protein